MELACLHREQNDTSIAAGYAVELLGEGTNEAASSMASCTGVIGGQMSVDMFVVSNSAEMKLCHVLIKSRCVATHHHAFPISDSALRKQR